MTITLLSVNYDAGKYRKGENLGLKALEAFLTLRGHNVIIYDRNFVDIEDNELYNYIAHNHSRIVGFSVSFGHQIYETIRVAQILRNKLREVHFTIGGQGISFVVQRILEENDVFDSGICFEGEYAFLELIDYVENKNTIFDAKSIYFNTPSGVIFNGFLDPIENLDELPFMNRSVSYKNEIAHISMITSRGCVGRCLFCSSGFFSNRYHNKKKWRFRTAENIINEIISIKANYKELAVSFVDDNFLGGTQEGYERAKEFCAIIKRNGISLRWSMECRVDDVDYDLFMQMREAGLSNVFLGIESGNEADLQLFNKGISLSEIDKAIDILNNLEITYNIGFIMFHPTSSISGLQKNANFLKKYYVADSRTLLNELTLYPGTPLIEYYKRKNLIKIDGYSINYSYDDSCVEEVLKAAKRDLEIFSAFERRINETIFKIQNNKHIDRQGSVIKDYVEIKKRLSDFEADLFIEMCTYVDRLDYLHLRQEKKIKEYLSSLNKKMKELEEDYRNEYS